MYIDFPRAKNTQPSSVLDFNVPYFQLVDGAHVTFYGKASKQTIIQSPEVLITYKDGKDVRLGNYQTCQVLGCKITSPKHETISKLRNQGTIFCIFYFTILFQMLKFYPKLRKKKQENITHLGWWPKFT